MAWNFIWPMFCVTLSIVYSCHASLQAEGKAQTGLSGGKQVRNPVSVPCPYFFLSDLSFSVTRRCQSQEAVQKLILPQQSWNYLCLQPRISSSPEVERRIYWQGHVKVGVISCSVESTQSGHIFSAPLEGVAQPSSNLSTELKPPICPCIQPNKHLSTW